VSQAQFLQMTRLVRFDLTDVHVAGVTTEGNRATVRIAYHFMMPTISTDPLPGEASEVWLREPDGQWCKEDEPIVLPFPAAGQSGSPVPVGGPPPGATPK
jgi:hypothetical protein